MPAVHSAIRTDVRLTRQSFIWHDGQVTSSSERAAQLRTVYEQLQLRRHQRRDLEWRNAIALWTVLLLLANVLASHSEAWADHLSNDTLILLALSLVGLAIAHTWYVRSISGDQIADLKLGHRIERAMGVSHVNGLGQESPSEKRHSAYWVQIVVTWTLVFWTVMIIAGVIEPPPKFGAYFVDPSLVKDP